MVEGSEPQGNNHIMGETDSTKGGQALLLIPRKSSTHLRVVQTSVRHVRTRATHSGCGITDVTGWNMISKLDRRRRAEDGALGVRTEPREERFPERTKVQMERGSDLPVGTRNGEGVIPKRGPTRIMITYGAMDLWLGLNSSLLRMPVCTSEYDVKRPRTRRWR